MAGEITVSEVKDSPAAFSIGRTAREAGVWECVGTSFTAVFPPGHEIDESLVRKIREEADPDFVPLLITKKFKTPADTEETVSYFVIGRHVPSSEWVDDSVDPVKLDGVPVKFPFDQNAIFAIRTLSTPWPKGSWQVKVGVPEIPLPFNNGVFLWLQEEEHIRRNWSKAEIVRELLDSRDERQAKELDALRSELRYAFQQEWSLAKRCIEEGRFVPKPWEKAPTVDLGAK
jgi:hypothetical protein